jgi:putative transposase
MTKTMRRKIDAGLRPASDNDVALMRRLDEIFTAWPFFGARRITAMLRAEGTRTSISS